ncbi:MAG: glycoside hydrolase [Bryobacteraceae bacterium]
MNTAGMKLSCMVAAFWCVLYAPPLKAAETSMRNSRLSVTLDATGMLHVRDLAADLEWRQTPSGDAFQVASAQVRGGPGHQEILAALTGPAALRMSVVLPADSAEIRTKLYAGAPLKYRKSIAYPHSFTAPRSTAELALPYQEGILLKLDDRKPIDVAGDLFSLAGWPPGGLTMPWFGVVNGEAGALAIIATPFDADVRLKWTSDSLSAQTEWLPSFGEWRYPREVIYWFTSKGGYVALAKRYREYVRGLGRFRTLRDKAADNPALANFLGSAHIWPNGELLAPSFLDELKRAGFARATIMLQHGFDPRRASELLRKAHEHGYLLGRYDNYNLTGKPEWNYRAGLDAAKDPGGKPLERGGGKILTCGRQAWERALLQQPSDLAAVPYDVQSMDTLLSQKLRECWDPAHPASREEDAGFRRSIMAVASRQYRQVTGSEDGMDFAFDQTDFLEGPMTLHRFIDKPMRSTVWEETADAGPAVRRRGKEETKDFKLLPAPPGDDYKAYAMNEARRVPLLELVYHDSVSTTSHWRWSNMRVRDFWWKADLLNVLYGNRPMWFIDREIWDRHRQRLVESYRKVCGWNARIGLDEMVAHEWLTPDRAVQRTRWSSGAAVTVNFSDKPFHAGAFSVPPRDYVISR